MQVTRDARPLAHALSNANFQVARQLTHAIGVDSNCNRQAQQRPPGRETPRLPTTGRSIWMRTAAPGSLQGPLLVAP